jgi:hypothetical protein
MKKNSSEDKGRGVDLRIKELEKALEYEKLRSLAYSTMIDIAEKEFNIPDQKKTWGQTVASLHEGSLKSIGVLCGLFGNGRQAYYQYKHHSLKRKILEQTLVSSVNEIR